MYNSLSKTVLKYLFNIHSFKHHCHKKISFVTAVQRTVSGDWSFRRGFTCLREYNLTGCHPIWKCKHDVLYMLAVRKLVLYSQCIIWTPLNAQECFQIKWHSQIFRNVSGYRPQNQILDGPVLVPLHGSRVAKQLQNCDHQWIHYCLCHQNGAKKPFRSGLRHLKWDKTLLY